MNIFENHNYQKDLKYAAGVLSIDRGTILITGATGLIGSFIIDTLVYANKYLNKSFKIIALSRSLEKMQKRFPYYKSMSIALWVQDVCEPLAVHDDIDYIINAASSADPGTYAKFPAETIVTNIIGTKNILDYAKKHKHTKVLLTSTMEVYGKTTESPLAESNLGIVDFNEVRSSYPESKRTAELLCRSYCDEYGIYAIIARLGYIYGPTMTNTDNKVVAQFIRNCLNGQDIVLKSNGEQSRSYCYVADTVAGIFITLLHGKNGEAYNVANTESTTTIAEMARVVAEIASAKIVFDLPNEIEKKGFSKPMDAILDESKLKLLGYVPRYTLRDGLEQTIRILKVL
ncbi:NAD-dependent epimerase/dehydratase family protein [Clostridium ljungdahlii]|nr:NAD-dependent epimerase/dehydratase family protein [Clostridium ljungdahlii]